LSRVPRQVACTVLRGDRRSNAAVLPDSAISSAAVTVFTPGMSASRAACWEKGPIASSMRASSAPIWALMRSLLSSIICRIVA